MSKSYETIKAELQAIYAQLTKEEKALLASKKQEIIAGRGIQSEITDSRKD